MLEPLQIVPYDPQWPRHFADECVSLGALGFLELEHFGSTAIPGLQAKAVIDIMAKVASLPIDDSTLGLLAETGYAPFETGMRDRLFLHKSPPVGPGLHLHILPAAHWDHAHERLFRDYLLTHPEDARAYGMLKAKLAKDHAKNRLAYTLGKTEFVQQIVNAAREARNLPQVNVWID